MAGSKSIFFLLAAVSVSQCDAKMFRGEENRTSETDVESSLAIAMSGDILTERLEHYEVILRPMFAALPTNAVGRLEHQAVRYALHRLFVKEHGWFIKGLEPIADQFNGASNPKTLAKASWVPAMLQDQLEKRLGSHGLDLHELASLAAVLEDLIHQEASKRLEDVYHVLGMPTQTPIRRAEVDRALETYMMVFLIARNVSLENPAEAVQKFARFSQTYKGWDVARAWISRIKDRHFPEGIGEKGVDFSHMARIVGAIGDEYSVFNDGECKDLKRALAGMEGGNRKAARIRLADFYNSSRHTRWRFTESKEYLQALGALDESNASQLQVIVPNYIMSRPNCLEATTLYAVCCRNECEDLMATLETDIAASDASPRQVVDVVSTLSSDTIVAPRELSEQLVGRLNEVARTQGGNVLLHSRLFAQWMHHAYPFECPYPHEAGSINPQTAEEWLSLTGQSVSASEQEIQKVVDESCAISEEDGAELPWTHVDEVLGRHSVPARATKAIFLLAISLWAILIFSLVWYVGHGNLKPEWSTIVARLLGIYSLSIVAFAFDFLDGATFAFEVVGILVFVAVKMLGVLPGSRAVVEKDYV